MRYKFIRVFNQYEKEMMSEYEKKQMAKAQAVRELTKDLMEKATVEPTSDDCIKIIIDI